MNSPDKMAEVRARFNLPEPGAAHECRAERPGPTERAQRLSGDHDCYEGQWVLHGPHDYEVGVQNWLGKTEATVLR